MGNIPVGKKVNTPNVNTWNWVFTFELPGYLLFMQIPRLHESPWNDHFTFGIRLRSLLVTEMAG